MSDTAPRIRRVWRGLHSAAAGFGLWGIGIAASYLLARTIFRSSRRSRDEEMRALVEQLAASEPTPARTSS